jgi:hypothetical protein
MEMNMTNTRRLPRINVPDHVENEAAYIRAAQARIAANAAKGARNRWIEESGKEIVELCINFLFESGEFQPTQIIDANGGLEYRTHPLVRASFGEFRSKMIQSELDWGRLTKGQEQAVLRMIDKAKERIAARDAAKDEKRATAKHVGTVGERRDFTLTVKFTTAYETQFGVTHVHVMEDVEGNVVVYKGSKVIGEKGETITVKATIKEHGERDGIAQTIISRPK